MKKAAMLEPHKWGLDPFFRAYVKLYICDIHKMPVYPTAPASVTRVFAYRNHPVCQVDLVGIIVKVIQKERFMVYDVDDGTGVISCACWKPYEVKPDCPAMEELPWQLVEKLHQVCQQQEDARSGYSLGDLLHIRGKIKVYQDRKELACSYHVKLKDPMAEVSYMLERASLYTSCYDKPCIVSDDQPLDQIPKVGEASRRQKLLEHFEECHLTTVTKHQLCDLVSQTAEDVLGTETAVRELQEDGYLYQHPRDKHYMVVEYNLDLQRAVLTVLQQLAKQTRDVGKGSHVLKILEELRKWLPYAQLQVVALQRVLRKLEEESSIVSVTNQHFLALEV